MGETNVKPFKILTAFSSMRNPIHGELYGVKKNASKRAFRKPSFFREGWIVFVTETLPVKRTVTSMSGAT